MITLGSIFLGVLFVPRLGDLLGRRPVVYTGLIFSIPVLCGATFAAKLLTLDIVVLFAGPCIIARMGCGFLLLMEHMPTTQQAKVGAVIMVSEGLCQVLWVFFLGVISKDTTNFMYCAIGLNVCSAIMFYWVPESPRYLYGINNLDKCAEVLTYIAKMNGVQDYEKPKFEPEYDIHIGAEEIDVTADNAGPDMQGKN